MWLQAAQVAYAAAHRGAGQQEVLGLFRVTEERSTPTNPHPMVVRRASVQPRRTWRSARAVRPASAERTLANWKSLSSAKKRVMAKISASRYNMMFRTKFPAPRHSCWWWCSPEALTLAWRRSCDPSDSWSFANNTVMYRPSFRPIFRIGTRPMS